MIWKKIIALVDCYNYQNWTSTSRSKYVPLKIMDEITYLLTIEVWELPLENFITHFKIYTGITTQGLPFLKQPCVVMPVTGSGKGFVPDDSKPLSGYIHAGRHASNLALQCISPTFSDSWL